MIYDVKCPHCGEQIEFHSDDVGGDVAVAFDKRGWPWFKHECPAGDSVTARFWSTPLMSEEEIEALRDASSDKRQPIPTVTVDVEVLDASGNILSHEALTVRAAREKYPYALTELTRSRWQWLDHPPDEA